MSAMHTGRTATITPALDIVFRCRSCGAEARVQAVSEQIAGKGGGKIVCTAQPGHETLPQTRKQLRQLERHAVRRSTAGEVLQRRIEQRYDVQADRR